MLARNPIAPREIRSPGESRPRGSKLGRGEYRGTIWGENGGGGIYSKGGVDDLVDGEIRGDRRQTLSHQVRLIGLETENSISTDEIPQYWESARFHNFRDPLVKTMAFLRVVIFFPITHRISP
jgi:hypothetical protein